MTNALVVCVALYAVAVASYPWSNDYYYRPQRAVMFGGYYSNPLFRRNYDYVPQGSMSAFVTRDAVATNTVAGQGIPTVELPLDQEESKETITERNVGAAEEEAALPPIRTPAKVPHLAVDEDGTSGETSTEVSTQTPKTRVSRKKRVKKPVVYEDEEDEEEDEVPRRRNGLGGNIFFPISIGGYGGARRRSGGGSEDEIFYPSSATAIANAYSTGKGGVATSHATSFGDPYLAAQMLRNGYFNFKSKKGKQDDNGFA